MTSSARWGWIVALVAGTGAALGNFPQALTHIGHILAAVRLRAAEAARATS